MNNYSYSAPQVTDGINIEKWVINLPDNSILTYSMWDFGKPNIKIIFYFNFK